MVQTEYLSFQYKKTDSVFRFPDIALSKQEHLLILGESGMGKTTLLHLLAGILKPISGKVSINQTDLTALKPFIKNTDLHYLMLEAAEVENGF